MDAQSGSSIKRFFIVLILINIIVVCCYTYTYNKVYRSIEINTIDSAIIEYGSSNYSISELIDNVDGEIVSIKKDVDTNLVGKQEIVVEVEKNSIVKEIPIVVEVKDTVAPEIKIKEETVSIEQGSDFDLLSNLESVSDVVDGELEYQMKEIVNDEVDTNYYTVLGTVNTEIVGTYDLTVKAVDKYGNISTVNYLLNVNPKPVISISNRVDDSYISIADTNVLVQKAYSLIGSSYVSGGNTPSGFDCSGFVQYVYSQAGISISRSTSTQINDGVAVSYANAQPGDILLWGYSNGIPTHSALYVGNGLMIHAANPSQGVLISDVAAWTRGSNTSVIAVRRI